MLKIMVAIQYTATQKTLLDDDIYKLDVTVWNKLFLKEAIESIGIRFPKGLYYEDNAFF